MFPERGDRRRGAGAGRVGRHDGHERHDEGNEKDRFSPHHESSSLNAEPDAPAPEVAMDELGKEIGLVCALCCLEALEVVLSDHDGTAPERGRYLLCGNLGGPPGARKCLLASN